MPMATRRARVAALILFVAIIALLAWTLYPAGARERFTVPDSLKTDARFEKTQQVPKIVRAIVKKHPDLASDMLRLFKLVNRMPEELLKNGDEDKIASVVKNLIIIEDAEATKTSSAPSSSPAPAEAKEIVRIASQACEQIKRINVGSGGSGMDFLVKNQPQLAASISRMFQACQP